MNHRVPTILALLSVAGCNAPLKPCPVGETRGGCQVDISTTTFKDLNAGCKPTVVRTTVTACVSGNGMSAAIGIVLTVTDWIRKNYSSKSGLLPYLIKDDTVVSAEFARGPKGETLCNTVAGDVNPWGGSYVNLDTNALHGPSIHPETTGSAADDCTTCLADACPSAAMGPDIEACIHDHCAAVCPSGSGGTCDGAGGGPPKACTSVVGADCGAAVCCLPLTCYATDTGSACM